MFFDLGAGVGKVALLAASASGARAVGIEPCVEETTAGASRTLWLRKRPCPGRASRVSLCPTNFPHELRSHDSGQTCMGRNSSRVWAASPEQRQSTCPGLRFFKSYRAGRVRFFKFYRAGRVRDRFSQCTPAAGYRARRVQPHPPRGGGTPGDYWKHRSHRKYMVYEKIQFLEFGGW
eukprot:gene16243-biopygen14317